MAKRGMASETTQLPACVVVIRKGGSKKFDTKVQSLRFIARASVQEIVSLPEQMRTQIRKLLEEKVKGRQMPKFIVQFKREDVLWTHDGEPYYLPTQWITEENISGRKDIMPELVKMLTTSIFADEVTVIPEDRITSEVEKWSMLTAL